jgi:YidC/Oxa1 family membrane protein insertase
MLAALKPLIEFFTVILIFFYNLVHNYGLAIILLTILIRIFLLPLTVKQTKSMHEMQKLQPKLKALQEKYKNNKEKLQEEMMKFYSEHKVNPFGGCLPLLLQLPVFFALFQMLWRPKEFLPVAYQDSFMKAVFLGTRLVNNPGKYLPPPLGSATDPIAQLLLPGIPYYILVVLMVVTTYLPSKMMGGDPQQEKMMLFMAAFMAFIAVQFPAGVLIYWITTNVLTMLQQYFQVRTLEAPGG